MEQFGPYRIEALIGRGGMGEVHRAVDTRKDRTVALKRLPAGLAADDELRDRFRREAELAARLHEAHIIPIHDYGVIDDQLYLDMRLVEGVDLSTMISRYGPLPPDRAVAVVAQTAAALDAAHGAGLVHRDVKPSNVLLTGPAYDFVYLIDFGIARAVAGTRMTVTGVTVGTFAYMAPERFGGVGAEPGDHRVDVYALACVLYQALTGAVPYPVESMSQAIHAHLHLPPPRPSEMVAGLPPGIDHVVAAGLAKDPDERFASAGRLAEAARAALVPPPAVPAPDTGPRGIRSWSGPPPDRVEPMPASLVPMPASLVPPAGSVPPDRRRPRWPWAVGGAVLLVVAALVAGLLSLRTVGAPAALPADAAFAVGDRVTTTAQYDARSKTLAALYGARAPADAAGADRFRRDSAKAMVLSDLLADAEIEQVITVPDADISAKLTSLIDGQFGPGQAGYQKFRSGLAQVGASETDVREQVRQQIAAGILVAHVTGNVVVDDAEATAVFPEYRDRLGTPEKRHLANIVVTDQATAEAVAAQLRGGGRFADVAARASLDTATKDQGGDLGTLTKDQLQEPYADVAFTAAPGAPAFGPVQTSQGWNVGQVLDVVAGVPAADPAQVRPQLIQAVTADRKLAVWKGWMSDRLRRANIRYADAYRPADPDALPSALGAPPR